MRKFASKKTQEQEQSIDEIREKLKPRRQKLQESKNRVKKQRLIVKDSLDKCVLDLQAKRRAQALLPRKVLLSN